MSKFVLFEISWEVCNKVGGIHTVLSTKAQTLVDQLGDNYIAVGPWRLTEESDEIPLDDEAGYDDFAESCRAMGIPVRVGRWRVPGRPLTVLVEFSRMYEHKDEILARLWEDYRVDSISGGWDYVEPVLFGWAAARVIENWWEEHLADSHRRAIVQSHEWMTAAANLYIKRNVPSIGTVFTTHATMLGRALSSLGHSPRDGLGESTPAELADTHNVSAKHSLEGIAARESDVFTTVSQVTADEAELLHERRPNPLLPNGIDLGVMDTLAGDDNPRDQVRQRVADFATRFLGEDVGDAAFVAISGRYEFHNKGIDLLLDSCAQLNDRGGRKMILFVLVPAGNSGICAEVRERLDNGLGDGPVGIATHNLFDEDHDPVLEKCAALGFDNAVGSRVKIIQIPIYLREGDGFWDLPYEAVLRAMDFTCFPSYYEPWGYTPQESIAVGVPTITTDYAGFGRWAVAEKLGAQQGVAVLDRVGEQYTAVAEILTGALEEHLGGSLATVEACRETASLTAWTDLVRYYRTAFDAALEAVGKRGRSGVPQARRPRRPVPVSENQKTPQLTHFEVASTLPEPLRPLQRLARNFWWCWDPEATAMFEELAPQKWHGCGRNPVRFLSQVFAADLQDKAEDKAYLARLDKVMERFDAYLAETTEEYPQEKGALGAEHPVAYFSAEFAIHESLPIYSGGLGVLAGDHLKSASDLRLPLVGVGLFYRMGYMGQVITATGEQMAEDRENDPRFMAVEAVRDADGSPMEVAISLPGRNLHLRAWWVRVGRVQLYLLDANTPSNRPEDRDITRNLYGGDEETRILQEIALGRGGARLLRRLGYLPSVIHMNEGHAAFCTLERVARLVGEEGLTFAAAQDHVRSTTLFTTHTPVPAGHDRFSEELMRRYFSDAEEWVGVPWERFYDLGRDTDGSFNMTWLAMNFAEKVNGVSKLHGVASRRLLQAFWPGRLEQEAPIASVTNGIHLSSWMHRRTRELVGAADRFVQAEDFAKASKVSPAKVWRLRQDLRAGLMDLARANLERAYVARNDSPRLLSRLLEGLDDQALVIGFARRFAPYKRAHLMFEDLERLQGILSNADRPVRILVAGKAHPRDQRGKDILQDIAARSRNDEFAGRIYFLEDYDMHVARALVSGCDIWLNNPTRMQEASGTSGMKAAANGCLNLSIGDGWWPEAADGKNGWTIAGDRLYEEQGLQDQFDAAALYRLLEEEIVPMFYDRDADGVPQAWVERVVHCLQTVPEVFNTDRMVSEYRANAYEHLAGNYFTSNENRKARPKTRAQDQKRVRRGFGDVKVVAAQRADLTELAMGDDLSVSVDLSLGELAAEDLAVELVVAHTRGEELLEPEIVELSPRKGTGDTTTFDGALTMARSGSYAGGIRVRARSAALRELVFWV